VRKFWWVIFLVLGFVVFQWPDDRLHVVFCDVGQGDAILIRKGEVEVLVDGGWNERAVLECLGNNLPFWDRRIELVVGTHGDRDHVGGLPGVLERYEVGKVVSGVWEGEDWEKLIEVSDELGVKKESVRSGDEIRVGDLDFLVLWPVDEKGEDNDASVVLELMYGEFEVLLTGDISAEVEEEVVGRVLGQVEVLKVAHHGSKYSSDEKFLDKLGGKLAVIQVGKNSYGHPSKEVLDRLDTFGYTALRNDMDGEIEVISDGERWWVAE
jgi:competence protein ComEC